jgi:hypothetical protein
MQTFGAGLFVLNAVDLTTTEAVNLEKAVEDN